VGRKKINNIQQYATTETNPLQIKITASKSVTPGYLFFTSRLHLSTKPNKMEVTAVQLRGF